MRASVVSTRDREQTTAKRELNLPPQIVSMLLSDILSPPKAQKNEERERRGGEVVGRLWSLLGLEKSLASLISLPSPSPAPNDPDAALTDPLAAPSGSIAADIQPDYHREAGQQLSLCILLVMVLSVRAVLQVHSDFNQICSWE